MPDERIDRVIQQIEFREEVPEEVTTRFGDVVDVLNATRDNERLLRVAVEYTLTTVELALRILCDRLGHADAMARESTQTLWNLLQWLHTRDYLPHRAIEEPIDDPGNSIDFEEQNLPEMYEALTRLRNAWIHTRDASWLGWSVIDLIPQEVEFINRLYDSPERKQNQRQERRRVNCHSRRLNRQSVALRWKEGDEPLLHEVNMLYCDMKEDPTAYYFAFWPTLDLEHEEGEMLDDGAPYVAKCREPSLTDTGSLAMRTFHETEILVDRKLEKEEENEIGEWFGKAGSALRNTFLLHGPGNLRAVILDLRGTPLEYEDLRRIE
jgi:hypothetical protein